MSAAWIRVEVVYAEPQRAIVKIYGLDSRSSLADAIRLVALDADFSGVDVTNAAFGIFGKPARPEQALQEGDRIEIYRPLAADPKTARRARAQQAQARSKA